MKILEGTLLTKLYNPFKVCLFSFGRWREIHALEPHPTPGLGRSGGRSDAIRRDRNPMAQCPGPGLRTARGRGKRKELHGERCVLRCVPRAVLSVCSNFGAKGGGVEAGG